MAQALIGVQTPVLANLRCGIELLSGYMYSYAAAKYTATVTI